MNLATVALVFAVIFVAELPDKSLIAALILSTRYKKLYVWLGASAAFLIHVVIAVTAGHFLTLLPQALVEAIVAALFFTGAALLFFSKSHAKEESEEMEALKNKRLGSGFLTGFTTSFVVVFIGEWGDITQIVTANYAAKYQDPISVGVGAALGLIAVTAFGIVVGAKILDRIPARIVQRITAAVLFIFAILSTVSALKHL